MSHHISHFWIIKLFDRLSLCMPDPRDATMCELAKHALAVGEFLNGLRGTASLEKAAQVQLQKLLTLIGEESMSVSEATDFLKVLRNMPWNEQQLKMLTDQVADMQACPGKPAMSRRQALQNFTAIAHYFTLLR